jgi:hypothetical protein
MVEQCVVIPMLFKYEKIIPKSFDKFLTSNKSKKPSRNGFHPIVRNVARIRLGLSGQRLISSNQLTSNLLVKVTDSKDLGSA